MNSDSDDEEGDEDVDGVEKNQSVPRPLEVATHLC